MTQASHRRCGHRVDRTFWPRAGSCGRKPGGSGRQGNEQRQDEPCRNDAGRNGAGLNESGLNESGRSARSPHRQTRRLAEQVTPPLSVMAGAGPPSTPLPTPSTPLPKSHSCSGILAAARIVITRRLPPCSGWSEPATEASAVGGRRGQTNAPGGRRPVEGETAVSTSVPCPPACPMLHPVHSPTGAPTGWCRASARCIARRRSRTPVRTGCCGFRRAASAGRTAPWSAG